MILALLLYTGIDIGLGDIDKGKDSLAILPFDDLNSILIVSRCYQRIQRDLRLADLRSIRLDHIAA